MTGSRERWNRPLKVAMAGSGLVLAVLAAFMTWSMATASGHDERGPRFCQRNPVKDYLAAVKQVVPLHEVPVSRKLPFAPQGLLVYAYPESPLVGRGAVGFGIADEAVNWPRHLDWIVSASLSRVSAKGRVLKVIRRKTRRIGTRRLNINENLGPRFAVPGAPAYYRVDISFKTFRGDVLGTYAEYSRVMKPRFDVDMRINDSVVEPGQVLRARLENLGTEPVLAELDVSVEKREGPEWRSVARVNNRGRVVDARAFVYGGYAGRCFAYRIPRDAGEGEYRITERLRRYLIEDEGEGWGKGAAFRVRAQPSGD